jgi:hypothetical protein
MNKDWIDKHFELKEKILLVMERNLESREKLFDRIHNLTDERLKEKKKKKNLLQRLLKK